MKNFVKLNKNEMKMIVGGVADDGSVGGGGDSGTCTSTYFYSGSDGCGYMKCYTYNVDGSCNCTKTIEVSAPCGYA